MRVFVINPGSTSTRIALYEDGTPVISHEFQHDKADIAGFKRVKDQANFRMDAIRQALEEEGIDTTTIDGIAGRGGLLRPLEGGVYTVSDEMLDDLKEAKYGEHACNLGAILGHSLAQEWNVPVCIVDPVVTDELSDVARVTGLPVIRRRSLFHALSQRGSARTVAKRLNISYESSNFIVCHMGGGISIGAHQHGRVVEVVNALDGEGPFSPERSGALPVIPVLDLIESGKATPARIKSIILRQGGLFAHLGTNDLREVEQRINEGDERAQFIFSALAYNIGRNIASLTPALVDENGSLAVASVVLTGGMARSEKLIDEIGRRIGHIAPVQVVTGDEEMDSLAAGCEQMLLGKEKAKDYSDQ